YQPQELLDRPWHYSCDLSKFIAYIIDTLNHDSSISDLLIPSEKIWKIVSRYKASDGKLQTEEENE
ncbi:MAG: ribose-phosphate pyrophosphokinase, partial [Lachnospiraceae bacterium]|nr:ribose-phosphate pyrophosphokinase [Lachnospiraceae bacterium]